MARKTCYNLLITFGSDQYSHIQSYFRRIFVLVVQVEGLVSQDTLTIDFFLFSSPPHLLAFFLSLFWDPHPLLFQFP